MEHTNGIAPLICIVCMNIVGIINVEDLEQMHADGEFYVCSACAAHASNTRIETAIDKDPETWYALYSTVASVLAAQGNIINPGDQHPVPYF